MPEMFNSFGESGLGDENRVLSRRPYINSQGRCVIDVRVGRNAQGAPIYRQRELHANAATLRKEEWLELEQQLLQAFRERLVILDDMRAAGLVHNLGGLGTLVSEWETSSEITDGVVTMDGETQTEEDRQEFGLEGVPIPIIQKRFRIGERVLQASRTRGSALDITTGEEAARAVARASENVIFYGSSIGVTRGNDRVYQLRGLTTHPDRATYSIGDWADPAYSGESVLADILAMITIMETQHRRYGKFRLYIPGDFSAKFAEDFKESSDKSLRQRVLEDPRIEDIRIADALHGVANGGPDVILVQMTRDVFDIAIASDLTTIQWQSGSGWVNYFQTYAAWAPRLKADFDGRVGFLHATVGS